LPEFHRDPMTFESRRRKSNKVVVRSQLCRIYNILLV
jgi:hypothetical protein